MRKGILPAALIVAAAFGALLGTTEFSCATQQIGGAVLTPIFWQVSQRVLENVLGRALAQAPSVDNATDSGECSAFATVVVQTLVEKVFERSWVVETKNLSPEMSIPQYLVRRTVESEIEAAPAGAAQQRQTTYPN